MADSGVHDRPYIKSKSAVCLPHPALPCWTLCFVALRKAVVGYDAAEQEMGLLFKVINKLILQNNTVAVLSKPERNPDEEEEVYEMRMQLDRVLSLHANYAPDV